MGKRKAGRTAAVVFLSLIIAVLLTALLWLFWNIGKTRQYQRQLWLGDKYLSELQYEEAELAYKKAIQIDDRRAKPYLMLCSVYGSQAEYKAAEEILEQGLEKIGSTKEEEGTREEMQRLLESYREMSRQQEENDGEPEESEAEELQKEELQKGEVQKEEASLEEADSRKRAYAEVIGQAEAQYGEIGITAVQESVSNSRENKVTGLCFLRLEDFDADGQEELLLVYWSDADSDYIYEIWDWGDNGADLLETGSVYSEVVKESVSAVIVTEYENVPYLVTGSTKHLLTDKGTEPWEPMPMSGDAFVNLIYHGSTQDGGFGAVRNVWCGTDDSADSGFRYEINGEIVTAGEWTEQEKQWQEAMSVYRLEEEHLEELKGAVQEVKEQLQERE